MATDALGHLLALPVTPASAVIVARPTGRARTVQVVTGDRVDVAYALPKHSSDFTFSSSPVS